MNRLKQERIKQGMLQKDVAQRLKIDRTTYVKYETGQSEPNFEMLSKLADLFGVTTDYLLGRADGPSALHSPASSAKPKAYRRIPVLGSIPAGVPIEAVEDIEDWEDLPESMFKGGAEYFALKVKGDSMFPKYEDGDVLILRRQDSCESGQDCAVMVNGDEASFKRVRLSEHGVTLQPLNSKYDPLFFTNQEVINLPVRILGVVVELRRTIR